MNNNEQIIITAHKDAKHKNKKRLLSLDELAEKFADEARQMENSERQSLSIKVQCSPCKRVFIWLASVLIIPLIIVLSGLLYITSPIAERKLTSLVTWAANTMGASYDMRIHVGLLSGLWDGEIKIYNLRLMDKFGTWLYVDEGTVHPDWQSIVCVVVALLQYQNTGKVSEYLYRDANPLSSLKKQDANYRKDENSIYTIKDYEKDLADDRTLVESLGNQNMPDIKIDLKSKKTIPMVLVPSNFEVNDNLLEAKQILEKKVTLGVKLGTLLGVRMPRFPRYLVAVEDEPSPSGDLSLMPEWFAVDIGEFEVANFQLGPSGRDVFIAARFQGQLNSTQARLRTTLFAEKTSSGQWVLPFVQDLPGDVTLSMRDLQNQGSPIASRMRDKTRDFFSEKKFFGLFSLDYDFGNLDFRVQWRDTLVAPIVMKGMNSHWSRFRVLASIPAWPPSPEKPLQAQFVSRFGGTFVGDKSKLRASLASAQVYWGGERFIIRDINIVSPIKNPNLSVKGSFGTDPLQSFGTQLNISIQDIAMLANLLDVDLNLYPISGSLNINTFVTRGGEHLLWWTKPLPQIQGARELPGFFSSPYDPSLLAKDMRTAIKAAWRAIHKLHEYSANPPVITPTRLPPSSSKDNALQMRIKITSPQLQTPSGSLTDVFLNINAKAVDALKAPSTTAYKDKASAEQYKNQSTLKSSSSNTGDVDFTASGLPRGLVGSAFARIGDVHGFGKGNMELNWFLGGMHDEARTLQLELENVDLKFPGVMSFADIGFAYALPIVKRNWPWIDGSIDFSIQNWRWLGLVTKSSVRSSNLSISSEFKSFLDENGKPQQYMNAGIRAERVDSSTFLVRDIFGRAESKNLHALGDILALSTGRLREALEKKLVYVPSPNTVLMESELQMGAGRSAGVDWNRGDFDLQVIDENAIFKIFMNSDITAMLNGTYNFRKRVVGLKKLQFINR